MESIVEDSSDSICELRSVMSTTKSSMIGTAMSLYGSVGSSYVSSDGSEFPVQEILGRYDRVVSTDSHVDMLIGVS